MRPATASDAEPLARLCDQLGYPANPAQVRCRLGQIGQAEHHAVLVAETPRQEVVGWVHVVWRPLLVADNQAEIDGLVVDVNHRSRGVGRALVEAAEAWAAVRGCRTIQLRSNILRREAHAFYEHLGYRVVKTQSAFRKAW